MPCDYQTLECDDAAMATPRSQLVDSEVPLFYHLISRCVRRSWLCGRDRRTGKSYEHRKRWIKERLFHLARCFAVEVHAFTILDNHFHLVVYYDPKACLSWDHEEVVDRWNTAFPPRVEDPEDLEAALARRREELLSQPERIEALRQTLGSLSSFMKHLKQPIAWRANREDDCLGHFFDSRFYSGALLSEEAVVAAMAYVDLNPVRARIARSLKECADSSISIRLAALADSPERLHEYLAPLVSGIDRKSAHVPVTLAYYRDQLNTLIARAEPSTDAEAQWFQRVAAIRKRQRAYGLAQVLDSWIRARGWSRVGGLLPG